jgi:hypothetical protein
MRPRTLRKAQADEFAMNFGMWGHYSDTVYPDPDVTKITRIALWIHRRFIGGGYAVLR